VLTQPADPTGAAGTTTGQLSATTPGELVVSARIAGTDVSQTATVTVASGAPSANRSSVAVPDGRAGERTTIEIRLKDGQGNDVAGQADAIAVSVSGANSGASVSKSDEGGGSYLATYTPIRTGTDQVQVRVSGTPVPDSPFASTVQAGAADAGESKASVPACVRFRDLPAVVSITAFDRFGNRISRGGDNFRLQVNLGSPLTPTDNGDGTYTRRLDLTVGVFRIDVSLNGVAVGEPAQILVPFPIFGCPH
jgi:hypothetical protein